MDVLHTALGVTELEPMREFYEGLLGLQHSRDFGGNGVGN
jgi:catechol 2,3-dioxygenase-like lactoylglutathione lyase family enzyme